MSNTPQDRAQKAKDRITVIEASIKRHQKNINKLHAFYVGHKLISGYNYAPRVVKFTSIPKCEKRYHWTVQNLTTQINELEKELATLYEYGALI